MVCGVWRPDPLIGVAARTLLLGGQTVSPFWVKYCRDDLGCVTAAHAAGPWPGWADEARRVMVAGRRVGSGGPQQPPSP